jgi:membrane protein
MSNKCTSDSKEKDILKFIFDNRSIVTIFLSFLGFVFLLVYLKNISALEVFMQLNLSVYEILAIVFFFVLFFIYFNILFFIPDVFLNLYTSFSGNKYLYALNQPLIIFLMLVSFFFDSFADLDNDYIKFFLILLILIVVFFIFYCLIYLAKKQCLGFFLKLSGVSFLSGFFFVIPLIFLAEISASDDILYIMIIIYIVFLFFSNLISFYKSDGDLKSYAFIKFFILTLMFLILYHVGDGFKLQRMMLRPEGIAQSPSQSGWYLVKNKDILDFFTTRDYLVKYNKNIDDRNNYYINGYLIFNIGNVRVICPHDFESVDSKKLNSQELDFSRCLSLTSEDIKFMKRGYPNKNSKDASDENTALMVAKTSMTIKNLMITKNRMIIKNRMTVKDLMAVKNLITVKN